MAQNDEWPTHQNTGQTHEKKYIRKIAIGIPAVSATIVDVQKTTSRILCLRPLFCMTVCIASSCLLRTCRNYVCVGCDASKWWQHIVLHAVNSLIEFGDLDLRSINKWKMNWSLFQNWVTSPPSPSPLLPFNKNVAQTQTQKKKKMEPTKHDQQTARTNSESCQSASKHTALHWPLFLSPSSYLPFHISFASNSKFLCVLFVRMKEGTKKKKIKLSFDFCFSDACAKIVLMFWLLCTQSAFYDSICSGFLFVWNLAWK